VATPGPDEIRVQLDRILAHEAFAGAERARRFLRYVVERALAGESTALKEYAIGIDVFDRGTDYDPRLDSIVRVEAGRLRSKLEEYYNGPGRNEPVRIHLRRGGYVPAFEYTTGSPPAAPAAADPAPRAGARRSLSAAAVLAVAMLLAVVAWRGLASVSSSAPLRIAVLPLASYADAGADRLLADRITDGVTTELARLGKLSVVSRTSAQRFSGERASAGEIGQALQAAVLLEGTIAVDGERIRASVRLVRTDTDRKFWVEDFDGLASAVDDLCRRIADSVSTAALAGSGSG
jgi:TolB-like protein